MFEQSMTCNAHEIIRKHLQTSQKEGVTAVDGTLGNGGDLLFLTSLPAVDHIIGFDIQQEAINNSKACIEGCNKHIELFLDSHHHIERYIQKVDIAMFNLGYLPKGDKKITTVADISLLAIQKTIALLEKGGILTVMTYRGHETGYKEYELLSTYFSGLYEPTLKIFNLSLVNTQKPCPNLYVIIKK